VRFTTTARPVHPPFKTPVCAGTEIQLPTSKRQGAAAAGGDACPGIKRNRAEAMGGDNLWICSMCTLQNTADVERCVACETRRQIPACSSSYLSLSATAQSNAFSVLTLNVWFEDYHDNLRMGQISTEVRRLLPDFLCLQEMTAKLLTMLGPLLHQLGYCTRSVLCFSYGEMLWWRQTSVGQVQLTQEAFQDSQQGRHLHLVRCVIRGKPLAVATVHFESEAKNSSVRLAQLRRTLEQLQSTGMPFLLAGDTNLGKKDDKMITGDKKMMKDVDDGVWFFD
jgi:endonuclease/exonuclease/phosphatase family metal-dependent hydrolase